ncbi:MAG: binding-protein-dependent transport system inner rane component [Phycisphaerales bacterium]|nr:binding-protein-dependent transport system inner rane component [Phycisphaerales bacterium]
MTAYLIRRLLFGAALIFLSTIVSFTIIRASPGMMVVTDDPTVSQQYIEQRRHLYGQDQPGWKQYCNWLGVTRLFSSKADPGIFQRSLGRSSKYDQPVSTILPARINATLILNVVTLLFTWMLAIPLGTYAAARQYRLPDKIATIFSFIGMSLPGFFLALLLLWLFASRVQWLPPGGLRDPLNHDQMSVVNQSLDYLRHLIIPVVVLTFGALAGLQRIARANMVETLGQQFITTARAKGLSEMSVIFKHALRNAINPLVTLLGFEFAALFGGAALLENVINYDGMGKLLLDALYNKDSDLIMSVFLIGSVMLVVGNLIGEILLAWVDPRISHA